MGISRSIGFSLCTLVATSLPSKTAEAIIGVDCLVPERQRYYETYVVQDEKENLWTIADRVYKFRQTRDSSTGRVRHLPTEIAKTNGIKKTLLHS